MDAFNDILTVEKEAEQAINTAKEEAEATIVAARFEHQTQLELESVKFQEAEKSALATQQLHVDKLIEKIQSGVKTQITAIEKLFTTQKATLKSVIKQNF